MAYINTEMTDGGGGKPYKKKPPKAAPSNTSSPIPQDVWDKMPDNIKSNIVDTAQNTGIDPTPGQIAGTKKPEQSTTVIPAEPMQPIVQQPAQADFDAQEYINALNEARLQEQMAALEAAQSRALTGLENTYTGRQGALDRAKTGKLTALEQALLEQTGNLDASRSSQLAALEKAKSGYQTNLDTALQQSMENLDNEYAKIDPHYYDARNQVASASDVGALNFAQYAASRGIKGSAAAMPQMYQNAALQGQLGALNRQEAAAKGEIERARTTTQNQYESNTANMMNNYEADMSALEQNYQNALTTLQNQYESGKAGTMTDYQNDLALLEQEYLTNKEGITEAYSQDMVSAQAGINAQGLQAYIDQMNADRMFSLQESGITGKYGGQPTLEAMLQEAQLTGMYGDTPTLAGQEFQQNLENTNRQSWLDTIGRFGDNYQQEINNVQNDNDTTNDWQIPYLQAARQQKIQKQAEETAAQAAAASEVERQTYLDALNEWKISGVASQRVADVLGIDVGERTADYDIDKLNAAVAKQNADTAKNKANQQEVPESLFNAKDYVNQAKTLLNSEETSTTQMNNKDKAIEYLTNSPMSDAQLDEALRFLGITQADVNDYMRKTGQVTFSGGR